jgi:hypothetical protein
METWYKIEFGRIKEVQIESETEKFVVLSDGGPGHARRESKDSGWRAYRKTKEEAENFVIDLLRHEYETAKVRLRNAQEDFKKAEENLLRGKK